MNELQKKSDALTELEDWTKLNREDRKQRVARAIKEQERDTLEEMFKAFIRYDSDARLKTSDHTLTTYTKALELLADWRGGLALHQIDENEAKRFQAALQEKYADKTVDTYITGARRLLDAFQWSGLRKHKGENPFKDIKTTDKTSAGSKADPYSTEELNALLGIGDARDRVIFLLAADGGLRLSEICSLEWGDVDPRNKELNVREGKGRKDRTVHATERLLDALSTFQEEERAKDGEQVLSISRPRVKQIIKQRCNRADVRCRGIHNLRHTCGTRLYEETRDLQVVARHLGHSSTKTAEIYAHLADTDYRDAVDALDENGVQG